MIVLDASALLALLLNSPAGTAIAARIADPSIGVHVPHLADLDVARALGRLVDAGELSASAATDALNDLRDLDVERHAHEPLLDRIWELREDIGVHAAAYVALAEVLGAEVLTCDSRLPRAPAATCRVRLIAMSG